MPYIYKIINSQNDKVYIGKTIRNLSIRWNEHCKDYLIKDSKLYRAMRKYGIQSFQMVLIEESGKDILSEKEKFYISKYNSFYEGYNSTFGGEGESQVDVNLILDLYSKDFSIRDIQIETGYSTKTISNHLKSNNIQIRIAREYNNQPTKRIQMLDLNDNLIQQFSSLTEASNYILENSYSKAKNIKSILNKISLVCHYKRQTAYGFKWIYN